MLDGGAAGLPLELVADDVVGADHVVAVQFAAHLSLSLVLDR